MDQQKYGNNALIDFDSIVDTDLAILRLVQIKYANEKYMKRNILHADDYLLKCELLLRKDPNPLSIVFKEEYQSSAKDVFEDLITNHYDEILEHSDPTAIFGLMQTYKKTSGVIRCTVLCKNSHQEQYIKSIDKEIVTTISNGNINVKPYDSIFIKNYATALTFDNLEGKSIFVSNYSFNLEDNKRTVMLLSISVFVTDVNKVYLIDPYINFKLPEKIVEKEVSK